MGRFILGLIVGIVVGILAMTWYPNLAEEVRISLASVTAQIMRTAGQTAEKLGDAADDAIDRAEQPGDGEVPAVTAPATPPDTGEGRAPQ